MQPHPVTPEGIDSLLDELAGPGYAIRSDLFPSELVSRLRSECLEQWRAGGFHPASVGRGGEQQVREAVRGDRILWLDRDGGGEGQRAYFAFLEAYREALNRGLYLGLNDFEGHFALYPPGKGYGRHLDRFQGSSERTVTAILYLNDDWQEGDGGNLRLYLEEGENAPWLDQPPTAGTFVTFLAERFWHEVLPAHRERMSLTGWFKRPGRFGRF